MTDVDEQGRAETPLAADEAATALGFLDYQRATLAWKCADHDWEWNTAADDTPEQLLTLWQDAVDRSRILTDEAMTDGGLDRSAEKAWPDGRAPSRRWIVLHMIEEYPRHNGDADLLRESVDGQTGE